MNYEIRRILAVVALVALASLALLLTPRSAAGPPGSERLGVAIVLLLLPLGWAIVGLLMRRPAGRWLGLAVGIAVLPWAMAFVLGPSYGKPTWPQWVALAASLTLLVGLTGRTMFEAHEGRAEVDWSGARMGLLRWTLVFNTASAFSLFLFVMAYDADFGSFVAVGAWLLLGLVTRRLVARAPEDHWTARSGPLLRRLPAARLAVPVTRAPLGSRSMAAGGGVPSRSPDGVGQSDRIRPAVAALPALRRFGVACAAGLRGRSGRCIPVPTPRPT